MLFFPEHQQNAVTFPVTRSSNALVASQEQMAITTSMMAMISFVGNVICHGVDSMS